jgi:zinc transport system permease protein
MIGTGLSHVAFGATAIAAAMNLSDNIDNMLIVLPVTIICAILLLRTGQNAKIKGDAAIAMISVGSLAIGYLIMNIYSRSANLAGDVCTILFGSVSIMTLSATEVWLSIGLSVLVITVFLLFYNKIFTITFDEDFARASGMNVQLYNTLLAVLTAVIIVVGMRLMGALLISGLVIFPPLSAMRLFRSFRKAVVCSAVISVVCFTAGLIATFYFSLPPGASIVAVNLLVFIFFTAFGKIRQRG